jgi:hypothetical protein
MSRDDVIRMARDSGFGNQYWSENDDRFVRFAALVAAAKEQEMLERIRHIIVQAEERGAAAEREECARMIEGAPPLVPFAQNDQGGCLVCGFTPKLAAAAIRARSNVQQEPQK